MLTERHGRRATRQGKQDDMFADGLPTQTPNARDVTPVKPDSRMRPGLHYELREGSLSFRLTAGPALECLADAGQIGYR